MKPYFQRRWHYCPGSTWYCPGSTWYSVKTFSAEIWSVEVLSNQPKLNTYGVQLWLITKNLYWVLDIALEVLDIAQEVLDIAQEVLDIAQEMPIS